MSMFHNPFNSKIVSDITRFLEEHKDDVTINPCLDEAARQAADLIDGEPLLEDRRRAMREMFDDAVTDCGCRGTTKESNDFAKAVEKYIEEKRKLPPAFLKNIQKKKDAAAKKGDDAKKEEVEEESWEGENRRPFGGILEDLSSGESHGLRFEKRNNPRRANEPHRNKTAEAQYCLAVYRGDSAIGWIIPTQDLSGAINGYSFYRLNNALGQAEMTCFGGRVGFASLGKALNQLKTHIKNVYGTQTESVEEAVRRKKPYEEVYYKWFDRVPVDIMDMTKIAKEIQAALDSKADLEKVMPELVKKYRKG
jgi:hypothetical protein